MKLFKIEKEIKLYKSQFDDYVYQLFDSHIIDRLGIEIDGLLFKIQYITRNNLDLDKMDSIRKEFNNKGLMLRKHFSTFLYEFLINTIKIENPFHLEDIKDVLASNVNMDASYITFTMMLFSENKSYLEYVDNKIKDNEIYNLFPNEYFRFYTDSYNDGFAKAFPELFENKHQSIIGKGNDSDIFIHNTTLQIGEACTLLCTYCYQANKTPARMNFSTAKGFIDDLIDNKYGYVNQYNSPAIILEFIGGEPLMEIKLIRQTYEYFLQRCYEINHPWFIHHRISICSNGLAYFNKDVQEFFKLYNHQISFNISIDGNKELHDSCRIQPNKEGSYDIDMAALNHYNKHYNSERNSKMTIAPANLKYLYDSVIDFIKNGMSVINMNCIFEEGWTFKHAKEEYYQLKKLADYLIDNNLDHIFISIFTDRQEDRLSKESDSNFCGASGSMLSIRPNGEFYPCIRYMPSSVGNDIESVCMGTLKDGFVGREEDSKIIYKLDRMTRRAQTNDICFDCPIGNDCAGCSANGYQTYGVLDKKTMFHCVMNFAEALVNVYYWNRLNIKHPEYQLGVRKNMVPDELALKIIGKEELEVLKLLELKSMIIMFE